MRLPQNPNRGRNPKDLVERLASLRDENGDVTAFMTLKLGPQLDLPTFPAGFEEIYTTIPIPQNVHRTVYPGNFTIDWVMVVLASYEREIVRAFA